jgi:phosphate:Na+ symporter
VLLLMPWVPRLERQLIQRVRPVTHPAETPRFLFPEALKTPSTATTAVANEVAHLNENAHTLIALGISLRRTVIDSDQSLLEAVRTTRRMVPLDIDDMYDRKIKGLHSAIIAFIAEVQSGELPPRWTARLYALQQASRDIVEAVKAMKHLQKNLSRHGLSQDATVRELYDMIRLQIARLMREIRLLLNEAPDAVTALSFDPLRLGLTQGQRRITDLVNQMLRLRRLSPQMATSLLNDAAYAHTLGENLIAAGQALLLPDTLADRLAGERLALDEREIAEIATAAREAGVDTFAREPEPFGHEPSPLGHGTGAAGPRTSPGGTP